MRIFQHVHAGDVRMVVFHARFAKNAFGGASRRKTRPCCSPSESVESAFGAASGDGLSGEGVGHQLTQCRCRLSRWLQRMVQPRRGSVTPHLYPLPAPAPARLARLGS